MQASDTASLRETVPPTQVRIFLERFSFSYAGSTSKDRTSSDERSRGLQNSGQEHGSGRRSYTAGFTLMATPSPIGSHTV